MRFKLVPANRRSAGLLQDRQLSQGLRVHSEAFFRGWEIALAHFLGVLAESFLDNLAQASVLLGMLGNEVGEKAQHVVEHLHLPVAAGSSADADGRDGQPPGD